MNLAARDIRHNKLRFVLTVAGVALLITGASGMSGLYRGIVTDALRQINLMQTDLWVVEGGTAGPFAEPSRVPPGLRDRVAGVPGVENVRTYFESSVTIDGVATSVVGLDWPMDRGEWLDLVRGRYLGSGRGEVIVDASLGYDIGDEIQMGRDRYQVVGVAHRFLSSMGDGMVAASLVDVQALAAERPVAELRMANLDREGSGPMAPPSSEGPSTMATAVLVDVAPGADVDRLTGIIEGWGDVAVVPHRAQEDYLLDGRLGRLRAQVLTFTVLLLVITAVVVTLIVYMLTMEKLHEIAMLKLLGARDRLILGMIVQQAMAIGVAGWVLAQGFGAIVFPFFPRDVVLPPSDRALYGITLLGICLLASGLGISRALKVEAQEVLA